VTGPLSVAQRLNLRLHRLFLALLVLVAVLGCCGPMLDNVDLGWQVAQGRWMVHHLAFYRADALNYPTLGRPVVDEYPLFQVLLYLSTLAGWWGPSLLCALGYLLLLAILLLTGWALDLGASATFSLILGILLVYLSVAFPLRPHLVTFMGIAAFGSFLLRHREAAVWTRFWPLALVQVVWTNCHSGFVLGPIMVAAFGLEMIVRRWLRNGGFPWTALRIWSAATALVFLGCFANPWGVLRFGAPFYQEHLEVIRAYVPEMQPSNPAATAFFHHLTLFAAFLIVYVILLRRGAVSWSFLVLAAVFYFEALQVRKAWPVFGMFLPLLVLSSGAFARTTITRRRSIAWFSIAGHVAVLVSLAIVAITFLDGHSDGSLAVKWREWDAGRTELPVAAAAWMKRNHISGRFLHRCEDGGWLQQNGLLPTWADTGFGKYDEAFIREIGLLGVNPDLLPTFLSIYRPDFVIDDSFAFHWPAYLLKSGWRLVFYSPNSSVWAAPGVRPDLAPVTAAQAGAIFRDDLQHHGVPRNLLLFGRSVIALHALGDSALAVQQLTGLPADLHRADWYWEVARIICFQYPAASGDLRAKLRREADTVGAAGVAFRAYDDEVNGDFPGARALLEKIATTQLSDAEARLLLEVEIALQKPDALELARNGSLYDLNDGERWRDLAVLEEQAGNTEAADEAWRKTLYYAPDLMQPRPAFMVAHPKIALGSFLTLYGWPPFNAPDR
jgi:tetratricopeptide (TPR) repeat protein